MLEAVATAATPDGAAHRIGARKVMYLCFTIMLVASGILMMPYGHIVLENPNGTLTDAGRQIKRRLGG